MNCDEAKDLITAMIADDPEAGERRELERHLAECAGCAAEGREERRARALLELGGAVEPSDDLLRRCREGLTKALDREERPAEAVLGTGPRRPARRGGIGIVPGPVPVWDLIRSYPVLACLLVGAGFLAGWMSFGSGLSTVRQVAGSAVLGTRVEAAQANVSTLVADPGSDRLRLSYEMLSRRSLEGTSADPEIRGLLIGTLQESLNAGLRLDAIEALRSRVDEPEVRQALLRALREDRNVGARLKALDALQRLVGGDREVRAALLQTLQSDDNAGVRIRAIDLLAQDRDPHALSIFERLAREDPNGYVRLRSAAALDDTHPAASVSR